MTELADRPAVLFLDDLCRELRIGRTTVARLRRHGCFPIKELPSLDKRPRWSRAAVDAYLAETQTQAPRRRRQRFLTTVK